MRDKLHDITSRFEFKIVLAILVASLLPLGATTALAHTQASSALEEQSTTAQQKQLESISNNLQTRSEFYERQVRVVATNPYVRDLARHRYQNDTIDSRVDDYDRGTVYPETLGDTQSYQNTQAFFAEVAAQNPNIDMIRVFWKDGNVLTGYKLGEEDTADYKGDKQWFRDVVVEQTTASDGVYVSSINIARATDSPAIRYATPLEIDGERVGLVIINYDAAQITEPVRDLGTNGSGYGMMIDPAYTNAEGDDIGAAYVANGRNPDSAFDTSLAGNLTVPMNAVQGASGSVNFERGGRTWIAQYRRVELASGIDYYVLQAVPRAEMIAASRTLTRSILGIAGIAAVAVLLGGTFISRRLASPIKALAADANAVAEGEMDREIRISEDSYETQLATEAVQSMKQNVVEALDDAESAREQANELNHHLEAKATAYQRVMEDAAAGDLTSRMDPQSRNDSMRDIARTFNGMMAELEETFSQIRSFATAVATSSEEVTAGTEESQSASEQVSQSIQEISADAEAQSENLSEVASETQNLSGTIEEVASSATEISRTSQQTADLGREGQQAAVEAVDEMGAIETKSEETIEEIESLADEIDEIGEVVELITDIAEQTNLLALNASIEAARAGDAGEGFAVVADEIKQLAGEVDDATDEVASLIEGIQASTTNAVSDIQQMGDRVTTGTETIEDALESLDEIAANVDDVNDSIQEISDAADDQAASTEEVASMIDDVADRAEQVSDESANVSAAAEEQASSLTQVAQSTQTLAQEADELQHLLSQFTVGDGTSGHATRGASRTSSRVDDAVSASVDADASAGADAAASDGGASLPDARSDDR
ncbi:methyl-accepting chemotaxis protein [Halobellus sp. Atlit-31R]|nr:methyl-accepting chemotaxis protein [Halobellus sp. Atlit-31R]